MELLNTLGIKPFLLVAQIINFVIILLVLKKFLYKPILGMLEKRRDKIGSSLKQAEEIEKKFKETEKIQEEKLMQIRARSSEMLDEARERAAIVRQELVEKAGEEAEKIVEKAKIEINNEREKTLAEIKSQTADLMAASMAKILEKNIDAKMQTTLTKAAVEEMEKAYKSNN